MTDRTFWHKQDQEALFADLLWSRPENRALGGKLLIIGGNAFGFAAPAEAYEEAEKTGIGVARVLLPDALKRTVGKVIEAGDFAPSTPSGSFSQRGLGELLLHASWADSVLLAGDLGHNSETAILLEKFLEKYPGQLVIAKDAADYFTSSPQALLRRPATTLTISFAQLQRLAISAHFILPFTFGMDILHLIEALHGFTATYEINIIVKHLQNIFVAANGEVSSTRLEEERDIWRTAVAARASVWWLQNPGKTFAALTTAVYESRRAQ